MSETPDLSELKNMYQEAFLCGMRPQSEVGPGWRVPHATWFLAMGLGGGLYLFRLTLGLGLGMIMGLPLVDTLSIVLVGIGGAILIADLGHPGRFLKAVLNVKTSWIARGAICDLVFMILGALAIAPHLELPGMSRPLGWLPWTMESPIGLVLQWIAWVAALVVMLYVGFVLYGSHSVPFWRMSYVPVLLPLSSLAGAMGIAFLTTPFTAISGVSLKSLEGLQSVIIAATLLLVFAHVRGASKSTATTRASANLLTSGSYSVHFIGGVCILGLMVPLVMLGYAYLASGPAETLLVPITGFLTIVGGFLLRFVLLKAAVFAPPNYHGLRGHQTY